MTLESGAAVTQDLARQAGGDIEHAASTTAYTDAVIANLGRQPTNAPKGRDHVRPADAADAAAALVVRARVLRRRPTPGAVST